MRKSKRILSAFCAVLLAAGSFAGCAGGADKTAPSAASQVSKAESAKPVTLRFSWWGGEDRHKATQEVFQLYNSKHPNVTIVGEYMGLDGYKEKLMTQLAGGTAPDIMQIDVPWIADLNKQFQSFADLNEYPVIDQSGFSADFVKSYGLYDGKLIGLPSGMNGVTMVLNTAVMEKFGIDKNTVWNWDNLLSEGRKVNEQDSGSYFLCIDQYSTVTRIVQPYLKQKTGNQLVKDDYTPGFEKADLVDLFTYLQKLFEAKVIEPAAQSYMFKAKYQENPIWMNQQACAGIEWVASMLPVKKHFAETADVTLPPIAPDAKNTGLVMRPTHLISINSKSENPDAAAEFLNFFFNDEEALAILKDTRAIPPTEKGKKICQEKNLIDPLAVKAIEIGNENQGMVENVISGNVQLQNIMIDTVEQVGFGKMTPDQAADYMIQQFTVKLEELKKSQ